MRTAVAGLGDLIDDYEFHYPQELSPENLDEVREALDGHGIYCVASGLHLDPRFGKGALVLARRRDPRGGASADARGDRPRRGDRRADDHLARDRGLQLPVPDAVRGVVGALRRRRRPGGQHAKERGVTVFLEHKNSEPAMKILMRNVGMTLHVIHSLRRAGDRQRHRQHGLAAPDHERRVARRVRGAARGRRACSATSTRTTAGARFDDDNMVGTIRFMETIELAVELRRAGYGENGERLGFDLYPYTEDAVGAVKRSVLQWRFIDGDCGADRRRGAACGAAGEGRGAGVRARLRGARACAEAAARLGRDRGGRRRRGARVLRRPARPRGEARAAEARPGSAHLVHHGGDLELHLLRTGDEPPPSAHFCLAVDTGLDELRARVEAAGVETRTPTEIIGRPRFFCRDPFGNLVELTELPA